MGDRSFNLADLFELVADECPDRLALVAGDARRTYADLETRANRLAHHLTGAGLGPGDWVGIHARNRAEWLETMVAAYKIRAVPVNVNYRYVSDELRYLYANADLAALVYERTYAPLVASAVPAVPSLRHLVEVDDGTPLGGERPAGAVDYEDALAAEPGERDFGARSPDDVYVLYTGGTTGMPKGVLWRHEDVFFAAMGGGDYFGPGVEHPTDVAANAANDPVVQLVAAPMMHGAAQWVGWMALTSAGTLVLYCDARFDADEVWRLAASERANVVTVVGDAMARPLADALGRSPDAYDLSSLITIGSGGAILSPAVKQQLRAALPAVMIADGFGASETGANGRLIDVAGEGAGEGPPRFTMGEHTAVLDDDLRPVAPGSGVAGRVARRGRIPLGYHKDPVKTAATFPVDADGVRWSVPGDYAVLESDGTVTVLGRGSVSINTGGEKVFPEEVESALKAHPAVFDAVVVGVPDDRFGERVAAVVAVRPGTSITSDDIAAHCRTRLAGYKVPREVHVVDEVVRSPAGKPDYRWATSLAAAGTPIG